jgi:hypothetical protein
MLRRTHHCTTNIARRRGLSTLEMVLSLPILLMVMALMVNFGTVACWKVRGLSMARHAVWGSRWPRTSADNPRPDYWPLSATMGAGGAGDVPELGDPRVNQPVARGPLPLGATVNTRLLDPTRGLREGSAEMTRRYAMLGSMGSYRLHAETCLLDDKWQYQRMGLVSNVQRRLPVIYALAKAPPTFAQAYVQAVLAILRAPFRRDLAPLDRDDEFIGYGIRFGWGAGATDFHPRLRGFCTLDQTVAEERVTNLIDRIQGKKEPHRRIPGVPERMAQAFIGLYQRVIAELRRPYLPNNPPPPVQAEIDQLQAKIDVLTRFYNSLPSGP